MKPISSGKSLGQYQWDKMHEKNHQRFTHDFGGKVFFVYSVKGSGKKKNIYNIEVVNQIIKEMNRLKTQ